MISLYLKSSLYLTYFLILNYFLYRESSFRTQKICDYQPKIRTAHDATLIHPNIIFFVEETKINLSE